jgi:hypothetical protein
MEKELGIYFGALSNDISEQLDEQGYKYDPEKAKHFQYMAEAIFRLRFNDILNDSQAEKCRQKLFNKIKKHVAQKNKLHAKVTKTD